MQPDNLMQPNNWKAQRLRDCRVCVFHVNAECNLLATPRSCNLTLSYICCILILLVSSPLTLLIYFTWSSYELKSDTRTHASNVSFNTLLLSCLFHSPLWDWTDHSLPSPIDLPRKMSKQLFHQFPPHVPDQVLWIPASHVSITYLWTILKTWSIYHSFNCLIYIALEIQQVLREMSNISKAPCAPSLFHSITRPLLNSALNQEFIQFPISELWQSKFTALIGNPFSNSAILNANNLFMN